MNWLRRDEWRDPYNDLLEGHLGPACAKANIAVEDLPSVIDDDRMGVLWGCVFEDFLTCAFDDGSNIVDDYLKRRGWKESAPNKTYMAALRSSTMSLYEISGIVRDESFLARDLIRGGEPVRVSEKLGTHSLKQWDRLAARIIRTGSKTEMAGGTLLFRHELSEDVLKAFRLLGKKARAEAKRLVPEFGRSVDDRTLKEASSDTEILRASAFLFTNYWLDDVLQRTLNPVLPAMCNSDGDELVFTTVTYPVKPEASADSIRQALDSIAALRPENETFWNWTGPEKRSNKKAPAGSQMFITTLDDGSLVLGTLEMKDNTLVLEVNSRQRAERGRAIIASVLDVLVGDPVMEARTVGQLMASQADGKSKTLSSGLSPEDERAVIHSNMDRHYVNLLDEPVPALGNITPRRAAKTAKGRQKLVAWLKYLENGAAKQKSASHMAEYDLAWMWDELGITELRR